MTKMLPQTIDELDVRITACSIYEEIRAKSDSTSWRPIGILERWAQQSDPSESQTVFLDALVDLLFHPDYTFIVTRYAAPLLIELLVRRLDHLNAKGCTWKDWELLATLYTLSKILSDHSEIQPIIVELLESQHLNNSTNISSLTEDQLSILLLSFYRISRSSPIVLKECEGIAKAKDLLSLIQSSTSTLPLRLMTIQLFAQIENLSEASIEVLIRQHIGECGIIGSEASQSIDGSIPVQIRVPDHDQPILAEMVDAWILPLQELQHVKDSNDLEDHKSPAVKYTDSLVLNERCLNTTVTSFGGLLYHRKNNDRPVRSQFKETQTLQPTLRALSAKIQKRLPVLLSGPEACGKTSLLTYACERITKDSSSNPIIWLQLADQNGIDAKSLLGSFVSSTKNPGNFEWTEGALTRAVRLGKWIVLEDIDKASTEVLSVIKPLVEGMATNKTIGARPYLDLGNHGAVQAGKGFAIFATRTIAGVRKRNTLPPSTFLGSHLWDEVEMEALSRSDIIDIISCRSKYLPLAEDKTITKLVSTWSEFIKVASTNKTISTEANMSIGSARIPSLHDLLKWTQRIDMLIAKEGDVAANVLARAPFANQALHEEIALEAVDIFLGASLTASYAIPAAVEDGKVSQKNGSDRFSVLLSVLSKELDVERSTLWYNILDRIPEIHLHSTEKNGPPRLKSIQIGRWDIAQENRNAIASVAPPSKTFALTGLAARLLERIAACIAMNEPVLLVGETGTGKTTSVQQLAAMVQKPLVALNLSQQTESGDLLGGFKPLEAKLPAMELHNDWLDLFQRTFSLRRNARYLQAERKALQSQKWSKLHATWNDSVKLAYGKLVEKDGLVNNHSDQDDDDADIEAPVRKAMRTSKEGDKQIMSNPTNGNHLDAEKVSLLNEWKSFETRLSQFAAQHTGQKRSLVFSFVEGPLVKAIREGTWVLLDEINLATSETLECLSTLLQTRESSIVLSERGDLEPVPRHPDFRLFACMNPATDVGKKDLPNKLRSRFTEMYVPSPDSDRKALNSIVESYIGPESVGDKGVIADVADCFEIIKQLSYQQKLADGANQRPHYSIRTLARALVFAKDIAPVYGIRRAIYEGFLLAFTMSLDQNSGTLIHDLLKRKIIDHAKNARAAANFIPSQPKPSTGNTILVQIGPFWLEAGSQPLEDVPEYILTTSVQEKLIGLARAALTRRSPVLIQGPTSAGKTSAVEYLARRTGHKFVRINNHEHTDLQEYLGSYTTDSQSGRLVFNEGLLVTAARRGDWIVLDELNLAPTDVLEALNRLLDDNRELLIPETGEVIKPHPHFMLFATQNPPGLYAGRKVLSRAFRNRFLEFHFDDVPQAELQTILARRCRIAPSYAEKIVKVFLELQRRRQTTRVFDTKQAFVTLRDLFRWGMRQADDYNQLAMNGYMLIAERTRKSEDSSVVKQVIEDVLKVKLNVTKMYDIQDVQAMSLLLGEELALSLHQAINETRLVWTSAMKRLVCLTACALRYSEPILLVGETGTGKTSVCEVLSKMFSRSLLTVNCHQNTDAADLLGGQRPIRNRSALRESARAISIALLQRYGRIEGESLADETESIINILSRIKTENSEERREIDEAIVKVNQSLALFQWYDGPLVEAMRNGDHILLDEISLADDSVLERLNSVLEPGRTLVLAERASSPLNTSEVVIKANVDFQIVATMNPGGDYGKKELSPALRNRFTEIWVPSVDKRDDILAIIESQLTNETLKCFGPRMIDFVEFYNSQISGNLDQSNSSLVGLRDLISWATFLDTVVSHNESISPNLAFAHGAFMTLIDGLPLHSWVAAKPQRQIEALIQSMTQCMTVLSQIQPQEVHLLKTISEHHTIDRPDVFGVNGFFVTKGELMNSSSYSSFNFQAETPAMNAMRILRAMQVSNRAIMLEGSPGAGKTSIIVALARACRHRLTRINLSDQTELSDLFGADLPIEGGKPGEFGWREAAFLRAMQSGEWVLLDEMNLASQSVLEGLNSCLDHRGTIYVPELGRSFNKHPNFRFFAAQNPQHQGGGRKGLPKSFLNRFTKVFVKELLQEDFISIMRDVSPSFDEGKLHSIVLFNERLQTSLRDTNAFSKNGHPWEFNLRDLLRWMQMIHSQLGMVSDDQKMNPLEYFSSLYTLRFRTESDRELVTSIAQNVFDVKIDVKMRPTCNITSNYVQIGHVLLERNRESFYASNNLYKIALPKRHLPVAQALGECIKLAWPAILVGKGGVGKTSLLRKLAQLMGKPLREVRLNSGTDAIDIVGGFEQVNASQESVDLLEDVQKLIEIGKSNGLMSDMLTEMQDQSITFATLCEMYDFVMQQKSFISHNEEYGVQWQVVVEYVSHLLCLGVLSQSSQADGQKVLEKLQTFSTSTKDKTLDRGRFAWKDGPVISAMRKGDWLLLDEANLCSSSVLDRLNSLLEPGGSMVLSERGVISTGRENEPSAIEIVKPHPDFRIFFAMDPKYGELSRAMRNRGMELYLEDWTEEVDTTILYPQQLTSPQEASLCHLTSFTNLIKPSNQFLDHYKHVAIAILGLTNPYNLVGLASRINEDYLYSCLDVLFANRALQSNALAYKRGIAERDQISPHYLHQLGFDLQSNMQLVDKRPSSVQEVASRLMRIAIYSGCCLMELQQQRQHGIKDPISGEMTILQRSIMHADGIEIDLYADDEKYLFALISSILQFIISLATYHSFSITQEITWSENLDSLEQLLASIAFLTQKSGEQAKGDNSMNRVIYQHIRRQLRPFAYLSHEHLTDVMQALESSGRQVSLRSGHALMQIWKAYLHGRSNEEDSNLASEIEKMCMNVRKSAPNDLIDNALKLVAFLKYDIRASSIEEKDNLRSMAQRVKSTLQTISDSKPSSATNEYQQQHVSDNVVLALLLLSTEYRASSHANAIAQLIESSNETFPLSTAVILHAKTFAEPKRTVLNQGCFDWIVGITNSSIIPNGNQSTTQDLFQPILLRSILDACLPQGRIAIQEMDSRKTMLDRMTKSVALLAPAEGMPRSHQCSTLLEKLLEYLTPFLQKALEDEDDSPISDEISVIINEIGSATQIGLRQYLVALLQCKGISDRMINIGQNWIICIDALQSIRKNMQESKSEDVDLHIFGSAFLRFTKAMLTLYIPNIAIDPHVAQRTEYDLLENQIQRLLIEKSVLMAIEEGITGNGTNERIKLLDLRIQALYERASSQGLKKVDVPPIRSDQNLLHQMHSEMWSFNEQVLTQQVVEQLIGSNFSDSQAANLQSIINSIMIRFNSRFAVLQDLTTSFLFFVSIAQMGLGLLRQSVNLLNKSNLVNRMGDLVEALTTFPTSASTQSFVQKDIPVRVKLGSTFAKTAVPLLLTKIEAVVHDVQHGLPLTSLIETIYSSYDQIWHLWTLDQEAERQRKEEEVNLYKTRTLDIKIEEDAELQEREFANLFPQYQDIMDDIAEQINDTFDEKAKASKAKFVDDSDILKLFNLHSKLFSPSYDAELSITKYEHSKIDHIRRLMDKNYSFMSETLDRSSAALQFSLLHHASSGNSTSTYSEGMNVEPDFYSDPSPSEARKLQTLILQMKERLESLIKDWPDQQVLQHVLQRCEAILLLDVKSPVNRLLSALEGLLLHTEDWQMYASSKTTLQPQRDTISAQIIEWRRLELHGWKHLLMKEQKHASERVRDWLFTLFQSTIKSANAEEKERSELVTLLDQFLRGSPLGQFASRLNLLKSMHSYHVYLTNQFPGSLSDNVQAILFNTVQFFSQFATTIEEYLTKKRSVVEREITDFVKLASWKDTNIHALKSSAVKTHRKLHQCLRKFRHALAENIDPILANVDPSKHSRFILQSGISIPMPSSSLSDLSEFVSSRQIWHLSEQKEVPSHLINLETTRFTLQRVLSNSIGVSLQNFSFMEGISDLNETILTRSEELAKATPAIASEENEKLVKNLETRKRKAWSDLMKELRRIGFSVKSCEGLTNKMMSDTASLLSLQSSTEFVIEDVGFEKFCQADRQHYQMLAMMPLLRSAVNSRERNPDIDSIQLQNALTYVENGFMFANANRLRIGKLKEGLKSFKVMNNRLHTLVDSQTIEMLNGSQQECEDILFSHVNFWSRTTAGLEEILKEAPLHDSVSLSKNSDMNMSITKIQTLAKDCNLHKECIFELLQSVQTTKSTFITEDEVKHIREAEDGLAQLVLSMETLVQEAPPLRALTKPMLSFLQTHRPKEGIIVINSLQSESQETYEIGRNSDAFISTVLVIAQDLRNVGKVDETSEDLQDHALKNETNAVINYHNKLRIVEAQQAMEKVFSISTMAEMKMVKDALARTRPFLDAYLQMLSCLINRTVQSYASIMQLNVTVCSLVTTLANRGFCKPRPPQQDQDTADAQDDDQQLEDGGVGLGEGEGAKDVTDTLRDDEEMEELQKDGDQENEKDENKDGPKGEKDAREMDQDFDGELGDVEREEGDEGNEESPDEEKEIEDAAGNVDPLDLDTVDEKTWAGKDEEEEKDQKGDKDKNEKEMDGKQTEGDGQEGPQDSKAAAEEDEGGAEGAGQREEKSEREDQKEGKTEDSRVDGEEGQDDSKSDQEGQDDVAPEEDNDDVDAEKADGLGRAIDQEAQQGENLDIDDDLQMDEDAKSMDGEDSDMDDMKSLSDMDNRDDRKELTPDHISEDGDGEMGETFDRQADEDENQLSGEDEAEDGEKPDVPREQGEEAAEENEEETQADQADGKKEENNDSSAQPMAADQGTMDGQADAEAMAAGDAEQDAPAQQQSSSRAQSGRQRQGDAAQAEKMNQQDEEQGANNDITRQEPIEQDLESGGNHQQEGQNAQDQESSLESKQAESSAKSLGDALKDFKRNLDAIEERLSKQSQEDGQGPSAGDETDAVQVEHVDQDEDSEMQALGVAEEEEAHQKNSDLTGALQDGLDQDMKDDEFIKPPAEEERAEDNSSKDLLPDEIKDEEDNGPLKSSRGMMGSDLRRGDAPPEEDTDLAPEMEREEDFEELEDIEGLEEDLRLKMEELSTEQDDDQRLNLAQELWKMYTSATLDHAFTLSEQLRLILAPTKATKLTGDFKTGKRLNMRKIIPFIASDYVKDKIWLRRHQPQAREYQVLLCVDDSKSMADNANRTLAFKSLALVCSSLEKLEVGQVGVMKFGRQAELLKGFESGGGSDTVGDVQGAKIFSRLPFDQRGTNLLQLLKSSYDVLVEAREKHGHSQNSGPSQHLWQLQIIISDGICQDHENLRAMLRKAAEAHIMVVFVILDSVQKSSNNGQNTSNSSILTMNSVEYRMDSAGRPQLHMKRYLDTFPFDYFVVVQDVADLPEVLSNTLRQWAERIAET